LKLRSRARGIARVISPHMWGARGASMFFLTFASGLFLFSAFSPHNLQGVRTSVLDGFAPVLAAVNLPVQTAATYVRTITGLAALQDENARLQAENQRLREWYQTALQLEARNHSLETLLNVAADPQSRFVTARIIADSGNAYVRSMVVLAGRNNNVYKGQPVLAAEGLVGRVIEAGDKAARVLLLTDMNSRIPVMVEGKNWRAILAGKNEGLPVLAHLPPEAAEDMSEGLRIVTSGHGGLFPFGLPVGEVVKSEDGAWQVRPYANVDRLVFVRIIEKVEDPFLQLGAQSDGGR
jgi:rod shape-determining protein MreC